MNRFDLLVIMARYPTLGKVKTRLAAEIGKARALRVYQQLLDKHRREFRRADFDVEWRFTPARSPFRRLECRARPQPEGDLGKRMRQIFEESFRDGDRRVVLIGTDAPEMNKQTVRQAFGLLDERLAVFQPTDDGGYALIGLRVMLDVFTGIAWSTDGVMAQTRRRLKKLGVAVAELPATYDVDTAADLMRFAGASAVGRTSLVRWRRPAGASSVAPCAGLC